ncbi:hypothetical protein EAI30_16740 [Romboutsia ilealis]|uniref:Uncharacterized protein n=1 Tax=Romboutsia faecis TaxID=2764597 RepID=A0ABR7JU32_9FIRM|nr:hypothetical protein [Romboutsia faecis]MBC5998399.1 hypothetical protein [Romboutsia faecis]MRN26258.1 hypothetical protein [Romboutsia ilealis]
MKKILCFMLTLAITITSSISSFANGVSMESESNQKEVISVYDGSGELIDTMTEEEFESMESERISPWVVVKAIVAAGGVISTIAWYTEALTGVNVANWVYNNISLPIYKSTKTMHIYARSKTLHNPYPPHSYEGAMWKKNNFYVVVK